ncbi:MAG TPA: YceI family protein [Bryobacteraceae bacterium]|nr:YceI family protein [Bryobacteraceae bacterium]
MKKNRSYFPKMCVAAALIAPVLSAQELRVDLDPARTQITFILTAALHTVHGTFQLKQGQLSFDPSTGAISGDLAVDAASGDSGSGTRDKRMTKEVLEAQRYPDIRFTPAKVAGPVSLSNASTVEVTGSFLIHGQAHEITIPMQVQMSQKEITATGKFTVPYVQWGMKNPSNFLLKVSDKVEINLTAAGHVNSRQK